MNFTLQATCTSGLETVLKKEIFDLGFKIIRAGNGKVIFEADSSAVARSNIFLRTADRIYIVLKEFPASDFDMLFEGVKTFDWENYINKNGRILVKGRSKDSKIHSVPVAQSMTKKAIIERLLEKTGSEKIIEDGTAFPVEIELDFDIARLTLDTSGDALFKRGYRTETGDAPIKETLAAGLVLLSGWKINEPLIDPFCGSGTIPIEAAMIKNKIAPGLNRHFLSMKWDFLDKNIWNMAVEEALSIALHSESVSIYGYDKDPVVIVKAVNNALNAEVEDAVLFKNVDVNILKLKNDYGTIVTNPPYGLRIGEKEELDSLLFRLSDIVAKKTGWSTNIITDHPAFEETFGTASNKKRLYNGNIKCYYYSYLNNSGKRGEKK
ncbi:MAG TPA: class I SAM-dependent RNA methyltransferase [Clostridiales bacterium]|nr:class I SAM-dependent RNA methyltransferase [Clostridiales bacterium]HQP70345.1 class I SAM-dependent RNA methyltransferase [Clostridiales bacterium]